MKKGRDISISASLKPESRGTVPTWHIDHYRTCLAKHRYSHNTIQIYCNHFEDFCSFFKFHEIQNLTRNEVNNYLCKLIKVKQLSSSQSNQVQNAIKYYYENILNIGNQNYSIPHTKKTTKITRHPKEKTIIYTLDQIRALAKEISLFNIKKKDLEVKFDHFPTDVNDSIQKRVMASYGACGCSQGRSAGMIVFIVYIIIVLSGFISLSEIGIINTILIYFVFSFIAMFFGKLYGLHRAKYALCYLIFDIETMNRQNQK